MLFTCLTSKRKLLILFLVSRCFLCVKAGKLSINMRWMVAGGSFQNGTLIANEKASDGVKSECSRKSGGIFQREFVEKN